MTNIATLCVIFVLIQLTACSTTIKDFSNYEKVSIEQASHLPSKEALLGNKSKVIIFELEDGGVKLAKQADVGVTISNAVEKYLSESNVEFVSPTGANDILSAINNESAHSDFNLAGIVGAANYAITGETGAANYTTDFAKAYTTQDKEGKVTYHPPKCTYSTWVTANIRIHELPNIKMVNSFDVSGKSSNSVEDNKNSMKACPQLTQVEIESMVRAAGANAVYKGRIGLQNYFAAKGYVIERRVREKDNIFKVSLGQTHGAKQDLDATIFKVEQSENALTGKSEMEEYKITDAKISDQLGPNYAWIVVSDSKMADRIKQGDLVKLKYEKGMFEKIFQR